VSWSLHQPEGIAFTEHKLSFVDLLILGSGNLPFVQPSEFPPPFRIFASPEVADIIECLPRYEPLGDRHGTLNGIWETTRVLDPDVIPERRFLITRGDQAVRGQITGKWDF
jgi:hypothetical protein